MILPKVRDPRFVTIRRGGTLTNSDHHLLALWAALCAEHVLHLFESAQPDDPRPREAIEHARAWVRDEVTMMQARAAGGHAMGAARSLRGAARHAAYAAGQAGAVAHVAAHELGAAAYAIKAARAAAPKARARPQGDSSASGSVTSSRRRFASSYLTTSVCGTTSAGQRLTAERVRGSAPANVRICRIPGGRWAAGFRRARCYPAYGSSPQRQSGPGIRCWLPDNRDSGRGQPGVLSGDIADLDPDHHRPPRTRSCRRQGGASWARRETWPCPGGQLAATDSASQDGR
jgi:hypothetical protein